jgi:hypothetical protein
MRPLASGIAVATISPRLSRSLLLLLTSLGWVFACLWLLNSNVHLLAERLGDADDAMRLVQVRQFLAGQGWFDLHFDRVQPPQGYESHWSRLVDAGLVALYRLFQLLAGSERAEDLMRATWPLFWLFPALAAVAFTAARIAGLPGAVLALVFSVVSVAGLEQFRPGRIDHHNVQIALAAMCAASVVWSDRSQLAAALAGLLGALMLAIGFENSPFVIFAGAAMAARYVFNPDAAPATRIFGSTLAAATVVALLISVSPSALDLTRCDALAGNIALPVAAGGVLLAFGASSRWPGARASRRALVAGLALLVSLALFAWLEPACLRGPFAHVDPDIRSIWLDHVKEARSFFGTIESGRAAAAMGSLAYPLTALILGTLVASKLKWRDGFPRLVLMALLLMSLGLLAVLIRTFTYAAWFAVPVMAVAVIDFWNWSRLNGIAARAATIIIATPLAITAAAVLLTDRIAPSANDNAESGQESACAADASYRVLARLPKGLVVSDINLAPLILALTPHSVLGAPYHRLSTGIVDTHSFFASPARVALEVAQTHGIDYVSFCPSFVFSGFAGARREGTLWRDLDQGNVPSWLELVPSSAREPIRIFKVTGV